MNPSTLEIAATVCFAIALIHTFSVDIFQRLAARHRQGSPGENFFHLLGEVEVVLGFLGAVYLAILAIF